jgi:hypothetical protein
MTTSVVFSEPLAGLCCRRCAGCVPQNGDAADGRIPVLLDEPAGEAHAAVRKRRITLPFPRCERCDFLLLAQAIERLIPADEQREWLGRPNADLGGLTPAECMDAEAYEPVFMALFFLDPCGPVS